MINETQAEAIDCREGVNIRHGRAVEACACYLLLGQSIGSDRPDVLFMPTLRTSALILYYRVSRDLVG